MTEFSELNWIIFYRNVVFQLSSCPAWIHHREWGVHVRKCLCASVCVCLCPCASVYDVFTRCCGHECSQITVTPPRFFRGHRPAFGLTFIGLSRKANSTCVSPSSISLSVEGEKGGESMPAKSSTHTHTTLSSIFIITKAQVPSCLRDYVNIWRGSLVGVYLLCTEIRLRGRCAHYKTAPSSSLRYLFSLTHKWHNIQITSPISLPPSPHTSHSHAYSCCLVWF